jgi:uncharacterized protein (TIGR00369 family)
MDQAFDIDPRVGDSFERQGFMAHLGARLRHAKAGRCIIEADFADCLTQQHGYFHAGVSAALADNAAGYAAYTLMPEGASVLTVEFKLNLTNPARPGLMRADAQVIKPGRTLSVVRATVDTTVDGVEIACAEFLGTVMTLLPRDEAAS